MKSKTIRYIIFLDLKKENKKALILKTERGNLRISQFFFPFSTSVFREFTSKGDETETFPVNQPIFDCEIFFNKFENAKAKSS